MKTLSMHNNTAHIYNQTNEKVRNGIACDVCGEELFDTNPMMVLTSNPPQKNVHCEKCGFKGYRLA